MIYTADREYTDEGALVADRELVAQMQVALIDPDTDEPLVHNADLWMVEALDTARVGAEATQDFVDAAVELGLINQRDANLW